MTRLYPVPEEMKHDILMKQFEWEFDDQRLKGNSVIPSFFYELSYYSGLIGVRPWENRDEVIPLIIMEWNQERTKLHAIFKARRSKDAEPGMLRAIELFLVLVFWGNHKPVRLDGLEEQLIQLPVKPVNIQERLSFVISRPSLYPAFIQLGELFLEAEKQIIKSMALEKARKR
ncbi:hypothetical protein GCM10008967_42810 [Bacillus carboniphilus]|uniref:YpoC-like domain-containing protein n=1 Tax=Bacillus carboniphilus TaxID=86663 RepID=A0ABP3GNW2_9BACI